MGDHCECGVANPLWSFMFFSCFLFCMALSNYTVRSWEMLDFDHGLKGMLFVPGLAVWVAASKMFDCGCERQPNHCLTF